MTVVKSVFRNGPYPSLGENLAIRTEDRKQSDVLDHGPTTKRAKMGFGRIVGGPRAPPNEIGR